MKSKDAVQLVRCDPNILAGSTRGVFGLSPQLLRTIVQVVEGKLPEEIARSERLRRVASVDRRVQEAGRRLSIQVQLKQQPSNRRRIFSEQGVVR